MQLKESEVIKLMREVDKKHPDELNRVIGMMQGLLLANKKRTRKVSNF